MVKAPASPASTCTVPRAWWRNTEGCASLPSTMRSMGEGACGVLRENGQTNGRSVDDRRCARQAEIQCTRSVISTRVPSGRTTEITVFF